MSAEALTEQLGELERLLNGQPLARQLQPGQPAERVQAIASRLGVGSSPALEALYAWRDGVRWRKGEWPLYLFPPFWQFLWLDRIEEQAAFPLAWCRAHGVDGVPFAMEESGTFLVAQSGVDDVVWRSSSDFVSVFEHASLSDLVTATCRALRDEDDEYRAEFTKTKMEWVYPDREAGNE